MMPKAGYFVEQQLKYSPLGGTRYNGNLITPRREVHGVRESKYITFLSRYRCSDMSYL